MSVVLRSVVLRSVMLRSVVLAALRQPTTPDHTDSISQNYIINYLLIKFILGLI